MLGWFGSIAGILGALTLALNMPFSKYGYILFLISAIALTICFTREKNYAMIIQQTVFTIINTIGVFQWIL